jgi:hypothetical protein
LSWSAFSLVALGLVLDFWYRPLHLGGGFSIDFHTYLAAAFVGVRQGWPNIYDQTLVAVAQHDLVPTLWSQPYLSPPGVAWIVAPLTFLPYWVAFWVWAAVSFGAFAGAMIWSSVSTGITRWIGVVGALSAWWVLHAVGVGQVVPLVAAGVVVAWRLLRDRKDVAAGLVLSVILLKPNIAFLAPVALLVAGRYRAFASWAAAGAVLALIALATLGVGGIHSYVSQLSGQLPPGADNITLKGALGVTGMTATVLRVIIVAIALATAYKLRASPGLLLPVGILASLIVTYYIHGSDLCLLSAAAWMIWEERTAPEWRALLAAGWIIASPFLILLNLSPTLTSWPWLEYAMFLALVVVAWKPLTRTADLRTRAPA